MKKTSPRIILNTIRLSKAVISLQDVNVRTGAIQLFNGLNLSVESSDHILVAGAAGSGKTMLLEVLAGRRAISGGRIDFPLISQFLESIPAHDPLLDPGNYIAWHNTGLIRGWLQTGLALPCCLFPGTPKLLSNLHLP